MADFLLKSKNKIKSLSLPEVDTTNIYRGLFDNMIWVIVLVGALLILIMAYLSRQSLSTNTAVNNLKKEFGTKIQLHGIDEKSASGTEQEFDEIDIDKHRLTDLQISSSAKSYLTGRQILDYASGDIVVQVLKMGARFIELDLRLNKQGDIVIANGITNGNWKLTLNTINLDTFCLKLSKLLFDPNVFSNSKDPVLLYLNITFRKEKIEELYDIIFRNFEKVILNHQYSLRGKKDVLQATIKELLGKLIIITSGTIGDTKMMDIVHLRIGDKVRRIYFEDLVLKDRDEMIQFNKYHLTIVVPKVGFRAINYNPNKALDYGCQIVAMHFQRIDDFLREYLSHFSEKSFRVKPFEFTRFHDTIQKGYDQSKIAYYDTYGDDYKLAEKRLGNNNEFLLNKFNDSETQSKGSLPSDTDTHGKYFTIHKNFEMVFTISIKNQATDKYIKFYSNLVGDKSSLGTYSSKNPKYKNGALLFMIRYNKKSELEFRSVMGDSNDDPNGEGKFGTMSNANSYGNVDVIDLVTRTVTLTVSKDKIEVTFDKDEDTKVELSKDSLESTRKQFNDVVIDYDLNDNFIISKITYRELVYKDCCQTNIDDSMYDLKQIKNDACKKIDKTDKTEESGNEYPYLKKENDKYINQCNNSKPIENVNYNFNAIRIKLKKLNIAEHIDIEEIEKLSDSNTTSLNTYRDKHIFLKETQDLIENKFDLIYFILTKQLKKALSKERKKLFTTDYEDKCVQLDSTKCVEEPICHIKTMVGDTCQKNTDKVPFNQYCLPRYEVPNRNLCFDKEGYKEINNETLRRQYHKKLTDNNFAGRWESQGGIIEIPQSFNAYCEFKFKTEADDKEYTMYIVDNTGANIKLVDFQGSNITDDNLVAKGTFVDNKLRAIEDRYNLPRLVYHGFAELKMQSDDIDDSLDKCFKIENTITNNFIKYFLGVYQYSAEVNGNEKYNKTGDKYIINGDNKEYTSSTTTKDFCYQMVLPDCNLQLQDLFGRNSKVSFGKEVEEEGPTRLSDEDFKIKLEDMPPIESFSNMETESPYDPDYINQFTFTGQLSLEFDPTEIEEEEAPAPSLEPSFSQANTIDVALSENNPLIDSNPLSNNNLDLTGTLQGVQNSINGLQPENIKSEDKKSGGNKYFNDQTCHIREGKAYYKLFDKEESDRNSLEDQYHKACDKYFRGIGITDFKNYSILKHVSKLNVKGELKKNVGKMLIELGHELSESDIKKINKLGVSNVLNFIRKTANVKKDKDDMYQTRASKPEENIVDTITSHERLPLCLKQYKGDEERCFSNNDKVEKPERCLPNFGPNPSPSPSFESNKKENDDYNTCCAIPKCFNPRLVIGSCTINADDVAPFYFEHNAHFQIKPHPENNKRRIIYLNYDDEPRKCESNGEYFTAYLLKLKLSEDIKMLKIKISLLKSNSDHLTEEEKKDYEKLGKELEKLKSQTGEFDKGEETHIDYHQLTKDLNTKIRKKNELYQKFKPKMKERKLKIMEDKMNLKKKMLVKLEKKIKTNKANGSYKIINKKKCLKYKAEGESLLVNIMYENDRRNLKQEMRSDWIIEKQFDETGKFTGHYKIRAEIDGKKYNLSRKPMPKKQVFSIFRLPVINPDPKPEDQLWIIKEVGDLNINRELGQTQIETEILSTYDEEKKQIKDNTMKKINEYVS